MRRPANDLNTVDPCPNCGHSLNRHLLELGCTADVDHCLCPLTLAEQFDPPRDRPRDGRRS